MKANSSTVLTGNAAGGSVILSHPRWADFESWVALRRENREFLSPWEPLWNEAHLSRASYRARLSRFKKMTSSGEAFPFHIFRNEDNRLIGACNLTHIDRIGKSAKLGYWIGEHFNRQGFARASVGSACKFSFETLGLHRIEAAVKPDNEASIRVLSALGFTHEGCARGYLKINGQWTDHDIYAKLSSD